IVAVQGVAGAGKSTVLSAIARVAEGEGLRVQGLAFQNKVAGALREETGIEATTVSSFVNTYARHALAGKGDGFDAGRAALQGTVLVLDEASMVANDPMRHLTTIANALGVEKLLLVGDRQQIQPIDAGKAFSLIQSSDVALARMDENLRQRTDELRTVAALTNVGEARKALEVLGENVREVKPDGPGQKDHVGAAAERWLALSPDARENTAIFTSGKAARGTINELVQQGLKAEGALKGSGMDLTVLTPVNLAREELRYAHNYQAGQVLEVARGMADIKLGVGRYDVLGVDAKGRVEIDVRGKVKRFDPQKIDPKDKRDGMSLSQPEKVKLHEGDQIKWTANDKDRGIDNSALARVLAVGADGVTVETADKSIVALKPGDPMLERIGLAYALNMHMAQGMTADNGIGVMGSYERNLSNQRLFNVMVTRTRDGLELFTDDKDRLARQLETNPGNKSSALETVGKVEVDKERTASPRGGGVKGEFNPTLTPDLEKASREPMSLRTGLVPDPSKQLPLPEKGLELGL
ncbi:MAG: AAA family ATPase, partial [Baekduia sp.]